MKLKTAMLLIALSLPLAGCGNKGPLVLPQAPVPVEETVPVTPVDEVPAEPVPADATAPDATVTDAQPEPTADTPPDPAPQDGDG